MKYKFKKLIIEKEVEYLKKCILSFFDHEDIQDVIYFWQTIHKKDSVFYDIFKILKNDFFGQKYVFDKIPLLNKDEQIPLLYLFQKYAFREIYKRVSRYFHGFDILHGDKYFFKEENVENMFDFIGQKKESKKKFQSCLNYTCTIDEIRKAKKDVYIEFFFQKMNIDRK